MADATLQQVISQLRDNKISNDNKLDVVSTSIMRMSDALNGLLDSNRQDRMDQLERDREMRRQANKAATQQNTGPPASGGGAPVGKTAGIAGGILAGLGVAAAAKFAVLGSAGIIALGTGIAGFFTALGAGDMAISEMEATGENLVGLMKNFSAGIAELESLEVIGGLLIGSAAFGALFGIGKSAKATIGMTALGAGIAGFFAALAVSDWATGTMGADGSGLKTLMTNIADGLNAFSSEQLIATIGIIGASGTVGAFFGVGAAAKATAGAVLFGTAIGGFLTALGGVPELAEKAGFGSGETFKNLAINIADGLSAFTGEQIFALAGAMAVGGALATFFTPAVAGMAAVGIVAMGGAIAGFLVALDGVSKLGAVFGADGSSFKTLATNIAEGLIPFGDVPDGLLGKIAALGAIGPAMLLMMGSSGLGGLSDSIMSNVRKAWNFFTGSDVETDMNKVRENRFRALVDSLAPLSEIDPNLGDTLTMVSSGISTFASGLRDLANVRTGNLDDQMENVAKMMAIQVNTLDVLANGGTYNYPGWGKVTFNKPIGDIPLNELTEQMQKLRFLFGDADSPFLKIPTDYATTLNDAFSTSSSGGGDSTVVDASNNQSTTTNNNTTTVETVSSAQDRDNYEGNQ